MNNKDFGQWNKELIRASQTNGHVDFTVARTAHQDSGAEEPILDADIFRSLYIGRVPGDAPQFPPCTCWKVVGATFDHHLDLSNGPVSGSILPSLQFEGCTFNFGFRADHTAIRRLSFSRCSFGFFISIFDHQVSISLHNTHLFGDLSFSHLTSTHKKKLLTIAASGLHVEGSIYMSDTELSAPPDERMTGDQRTQYALDFFGSEIRNDLRLFPNVIVSGGLRVRTAQIGGDLSLAHITISDGVDAERRKMLKSRGLAVRFAIDGTSVTISGHLFLSSTYPYPVLRAMGQVDFFGSQIKGSVDLSGSHFSAPELDFALRLVSATIDGNLISLQVLREKRVEDVLFIEGSMLLDGLHIGGSLLATGRMSVLSASRLSVSGDTAPSFQVVSSVNLGGADLKGQLDLSGFSFSAPIGTQPILSLKDADIGHNLRLADSSLTRSLVFHSARRTKPLCYPGYQLFEIHAGDGSASILLKPGYQPLLLDGTSPKLHTLSQDGALNLSTDESTKDFIRFFAAFVWGEAGAFAIVERRSDIPEAGLTPEQIGAIKGIQLQRSFSIEEMKDLRKELGPNLTDTEWAAYEVHLSRNAVKGISCVRYANYLFRAVFVVITKTFEDETKASERVRLGWISMLGDESIAQLNGDLLPSYKRPFVERAKYPDYTPSAPWEDFGEAEFSLRIRNWRDLLRGPLVRFQDAAIDLTNASCRTLEDAHGRAWGPDLSQLLLENFIYTGVDSRVVDEEAPTPSFAGRGLLWIYGTQDRIPPLLLTPLLSRFWFSRQSLAAKMDRLSMFEKMPKRPFLPQPYTQLAKVLNTYGDTHKANAVEEKKITLAVIDRLSNYMGQGLFSIPGRALFGAVWLLYYVAFHYGLRPIRASLTVLLFLLIGWRGVYVMDYSKNYLVQNTSTFASMVARDSGGGLTAAFARAQPPYETAAIPCGDSINGLLYAADVFIPLLDLRQESRCDVRSLGPTEINPIHEWQNHKSWHKLTHALWALFHAPVLWAQFAKSAYAVLGWVVISLTILTYSGTLRRWGEG